MARTERRRWVPNLKTKGPIQVEKPLDADNYTFQWVTHHGDAECGCTRRAHHEAREERRRQRHQARAEIQRQKQDA